MVTRYADIRPWRAIMSPCDLAASAATVTITRMKMAVCHAGATGTASADTEGATSTWVVPAYGSVAKRASGNVADVFRVASYNEALKSQGALFMPSGDD